jgi:asparagine synthase (glutamine-hydrolysing)
MCGINGLLSMNYIPIDNIEKKINVMNKILYHRGPDGNGKWIDDKKYIGLGHTRLSIIDLSIAGHQPMVYDNLILTFNGEIYNYKQIKEDLMGRWEFKSNTDTEVILALYSLYKDECVKYLDGMFSFVIWDSNTMELFCARDRIGIKPFYYLIQNNIFYFASEVKALIPFLDTPNIEIDKDWMSEYLILQYSISDNTIIKNIKKLMPGHILTIKNNMIKINKYWILNYNSKVDYSDEEYINKIKELVNYSIDIHLNSDVPISSYVSGGIDSSIISILASEKKSIDRLFNGKFSQYPNCDESYYAELVSKKINIPINYCDITSNDFIENIEKIIYHMDYPAAGPGVFPQYMISKSVSEYTKVVLGGQGGDEIFGGYTRYIIPYFEKCIEDAINGNNNNLLTLLPNINILKEYKPLLINFWKDGIFDTLDKRYFKLCDRSSGMDKIINWDKLSKIKVFDKFIEKFNNMNIPNDDFFNKMLNFDLEYSLPALLQVEDRVSMACSLESRVPLLNHHLIEFLASVPEEKKIYLGNMKYLFKEAYSSILPEEILNRKDKMGFPVPLNDWIKKNELKEYFKKLIINLKNRNIDYLNITNDIFIQMDTITNNFTREYWILINIELWYQIFYDKFESYKLMLN